MTIPDQLLQNLQRQHQIGQRFIETCRELQKVNSERAREVDPARRRQLDYRRLERHRKLARYQTRLEGLRAQERTLMVQL